MIEGTAMADTGRGKKPAAEAAAKPDAPAEAPRKPRKQASGHSTSIDIPHYVMDQIREYLAEHRELKFKHMVLLGLTKLGIKVEPEDLKPERRRGVS